MTYVYREYADSILGEVKRSLLASVDRPLEYLCGLNEDSDWAFVIKSQALIEAAVTQALANALDEPRVVAVMERLPLADDQIGKLAIAKELCLLESTHRRYIRRIAALRNQLAHRVEYVNFDFKPYLESLNQAQRKEWRESLCWFCKSQESKAAWSNVAENDPRTSIWLSTLLLVAYLGVGNAERDAARKLREATQATVERLFGESPKSSRDAS